MATMSVEELNRLDQDAVVALLVGVFEHSPWIVRETWPQRPFASVADLHAALCRTVRKASADHQLVLVRAHPDLVGRAARSGTLTPESTDEQHAAGLGHDELDEHDIATFTRLNAAYQARFGFPFVICARENRKASILSGFTARLQHDTGTELATALREIERIAWYRLADLVHDQPTAST
jgi:OHCU decarboxylase